MENLDFDSMTIEKIDTVINLDKDEQELLDSIENDHWVSILNWKSNVFKIYLNIRLQCKR